MGTLYIVGTPIGNLADASPRSVEVLGKADVILAEDTRVTAKLLARYGIKKSPTRCDEEVSGKVLRSVIEYLRDGKMLALVTDAGTPGISDPGSRIVRGVREALPDAHIVPIPGPSAVVTALSVSGMNASSFTFLGYPPHAKGRATFFRTVGTTPVRPVVFYESPHRMAKALSELPEGARVIVCRELTKVYEEIVSGTPAAVAERLGERSGVGEFVVIVE